MRRLWVIVPVVIVLGAGALVLQQRARMERAAHKAREAALRDTLSQMRKTIDNFRQDNNRYPYSLQELVPKYMRRIPVDPMTNSASWRLTTEETVQPSEDFSASSAPKTTSVIVDVHSTAPGYTDY
jgi:general secretion pathway protein G